MGMTNTRIAEQLTVSVAAIKFHLTSIYRKLGVGNETKAAVAYLDLRPTNAFEPDTEAEA